MVTVLIEDTVVMNDRKITSNPKTYQFDDEAKAQAFIDQLQDIEQSPSSDNIIRAYIVDYNVKASENAVPLLLHTVHYDHAENPTDGLRFLEDTDVLTVEEIESFRAQGIKPGIVFAYDNPDSLEPVVSEVLPDSATRFQTLGANLFAEDENTTFHLSFRPNIAELLLEKYGHEEEYYAKLFGVKAD